MTADFFDAFGAFFSSIEGGSFLLATVPAKVPEPAEGPLPGSYAAPHCPAFCENCAKKCF